MRATPNLLALVGLTLTAGMTCLVASCSSDDNPAPSLTPPLADAGGGTSGSSGTGPADSGCASDASTCNSCVAPETDPYNACSSAVGGCIPFDNAARVPKDPNGGVPQVP
jgi:hypothetical protein